MRRLAIILVGLLLFGCLEWITKPAVPAKKEVVPPEKAVENVTENVTIEGEEVPVISDIEINESEGEFPLPV